MDFRIADTAPEHPKMRAAGPAALGLWAMAGAYSMSPTQLTDGWVPTYWVATWPAGKRLASVLVRVGLWREEERAGIPGYQFHDFLGYQRSKTSVELDREAAKERMTRLRSVRKGQSGSDEVRANENRTPTGKSGNDLNLPGSNNTVFVERDASTAGTTITLERPTTSDNTETFARTTPERSPNVPDSLTLTHIPSGSVGGASHVSSAPGDEKTRPADRCQQHLGIAEPPPCRACGTARLAAQAHDLQETRTAVAARSSEARRRAELRALAITACDLCDTDGQIGRQTCDHDPDTTQRAARGRAAVQAALNRQQAS